MVAFPPQLHDIRVGGSPVVRTGKKGLPSRVFRGLNRTRNQTQRNHIESGANSHLFEKRRKGRASCAKEAASGKGN